MIHKIPMQIQDDYMKLGDIDADQQHQMKACLNMGSAIYGEHV